uniref:Solute carrier family 51 subunit alpha n=1 Tax=Gallus gallus TaxID=9031 RepID=A0A8V0YQG9_CHICK
MLLPATHLLAAAAAAGHGPTHHHGPGHHPDIGVGRHLRGRSPLHLPQDQLPHQDEDSLLEQLSPHGRGCVQLLRAVDPTFHDGGGDGHHDVLCYLFLCHDDGYGGGLRGKGGSAQHPKGRAHGGEHRALLLLLPLPAPHHHKQVRKGWGRAVTPQNARVKQVLGRRMQPPSPRTRRKLQLLMLGTFQYAFLRTAGVFLGLVLYTDGNYNPADISAESVALWINTVIGVSTLFGLWALGILFRQARLHLKEQNMQAKFTCFQILLLLTALQPAIFSILANNGNIACSPPFSSKARSQQMNMQLLIPQTFMLAVVARMYYRKQDDKPGYQPVSITASSSNAKV